MAQVNSAITKLLRNDIGELFIVTNKSITDNVYIYKYENNIWDKVGDFIGVLNEYSMDMSAVMGSENNIYVAYLVPEYNEDPTPAIIGYNLYVNKNTGGIWSSIGTKINENILVSEGMSIEQISLAIDGQDNLFISYSDVILGEPVLANCVVKKYDDLTSDWVSYGTIPLIANELAVIPSLAVDTNDDLYILYTNIPEGMMENNGLTCRKYNKVSFEWDLIGSDFFSPPVDMGWDLEKKYKPYLYIDDNDGIYCSFTETTIAGEYRTTVMKLITNVWTQVGSEYVISDINSYSGILKKDNQDNLYCSCYCRETVEMVDVYTVKIMKFNGTSWEQYGDDIENVAGYVFPTDFIFDGEDKINISYSDYRVELRPTVSGYGISYNTPFKATFITTSPIETIELPLIDGYVYDFIVHWGDGSSDTITTYDSSDRSHTYSSSGEHQITIRGTMQMWRFSNSGLANGTPEKLKSIDQLGNVGFGMGVEDFNYMFSGCVNLESIPPINVISGIGLDSMFDMCYSLLVGELKGVRFGIAYTTSPLLTSSERNAIYDGLYENYTEDTWTISMSESVGEDDSIASEKGWTVSGKAPK